MVRRLNLAGWRRRDHFLFFKDYEQPFFNVCTEVDVTGLVECTSGRGGSFFLGALYLSLQAANEIEEFRLRIRGDEVVVHPRVSGGSTVLRADETFGFGYFEYDDDYPRFEKRGREVLAAARAPGPLNDRRDRDDWIYYSVLPWFSFTSFSHARRCPTVESNPRIVFAKRRSRRDGTWRMAVSVEVHHALVDGLHVARFLERFEELMSQPTELG